MPKAQTRPIVIAHRGASGHLPEHTLAAYWLAIEQGADALEPDLVMTRDGVLIARHENALAIVDGDGRVVEATTDVMDHAEFAQRKTTRTIDGVDITGWFSEDFTLAELKTLRCRERLPQLRPANTRFDDQFEIATLDEILDLLDAANALRNKAAQRLGRPLPAPVALYPEIKHPSYFRAIGLPMEQAVVDTLHARGYTERRAPMFIQCFEPGFLQAVRHLTQLPLVQLLSDTGQPWDFALSGDPRNYDDLATPGGLAEIVRYAVGIGAHKNLIIPRDAADCLARPTTLITDAHRAGLQVNAWTFRAENHFLPRNLRQGNEAAAHGAIEGELTSFLATGLDGIFIDQPDIGQRVVGTRHRTP